MCPFYTKKMSRIPQRQIIIWILGILYYLLHKNYLNSRNSFTSRLFLLSIVFSYMGRFIQWNSVIVLLGEEPLSVCPSNHPSIYLSSAAFSPQMVFINYIVFFCLLVKTYLFFCIFAYNFRLYYETVRIGLDKRYGFKFLLLVHLTAFDAFNK